MSSSNAAASAAAAGISCTVNTSILEISGCKADVSALAKPANGRAANMKIQEDILADDGGAAGAALPDVAVARPALLPAMRQKARNGMGAAPF